MSDSPPLTDIKNDGASVAAIGLAIAIPVILILLIIVSILYYYSFRGMTKLGICSDRFLPYTLKHLANSMTGGILGLIMYFVGDEKVPVKSK